MRSRWTGALALGGLLTACGASEQAVQAAGTVPGASLARFQPALDPARPLRSFAWAGEGSVPVFGDAAELQPGESGRTPSTRLYLTSNAPLARELAAYPGWSLVDRGSRLAPGRFGQGLELGRAEIGREREPARPEASSSTVGDGSAIQQQLASVPDPQHGIGGKGWKAHHQPGYRQHTGKGGSEEHGAAADPVSNEVHSKHQQQHERRDEQCARPQGYGHGIETCPENGSRAVMAGAAVLVAGSTAICRRG